MSAPNCRPDRVIKKSPQWEITRHRDGETDDIIETILYADGKSRGFVLAGVDCLRGPSEYDTLRNVWRFVKYNIRYRADRPGHERIKSPGALFASGYGDCKSFSVAIGAMLRALGIPFRYRFAAYDSGDYSHVYVVADGVRGPVILDAVYEEFDEEHPYWRKTDIRPKGSASVKGINEITVEATSLLLGAAIVYGISRLI